MRVIRHLAHVSPPLRRVVLTLGNFDGVHLGHRAIVQRAVSEARAAGGQVVVLTFHPHPVAVLAPERSPPLLQSLRDRLALLRDLGADVTVVQRFTRRFAALEPEAFVGEFLGTHLELLHVVVGHNVNFGRGRAGTVETLRALGPRLGLRRRRRRSGDGRRGAGEQQRAPAHGRRRRRAQRPGAARPPVRAPRSRGARRAARPHPRLSDRQPASAAPACSCPPTACTRCARELDGRSYRPCSTSACGPRSACSSAPSKRTCSTSTRRLYGRWLVLELVDRLRGEQRFAGLEALRAAIAADVARAREVLRVCRKSRAALVSGERRSWCACRRRGRPATRSLSVDGSRAGTRARGRRA